MAVRIRSQWHHFLELLQAVAEVGPSVFLQLVVGSSVPLSLLRLGLLLRDISWNRHSGCIAMLGFPFSPFDVLSSLQQRVDAHS